MKKSTFLLTAALGCAGFTLATVAFAQVFTFADVPEDAPYKPAVERLVRLGVFRGFSDGTFKPDASVTRSDLAVVIDRNNQLFIESLEKRVAALEATLGTEDTSQQQESSAESSSSSSGELESTGSQSSSPSTESTCGNGVCDEGETGKACLPTYDHPKRCETSVYCPSDCSPDNVSSGEVRERCGDGICQQHELCADETCATADCEESCGPGYCSDDCRAFLEDTSLTCDTKRQQFSDFVKEERSCSTTADCRFFQSCPYAECGIALSVDAQEQADVLHREAVNGCFEKVRDVKCTAGCQPQTVECKAGVCVLEPLLKTE